MMKTTFFAPTALLLPLAAPAFAQSTDVVLFGDVDSIGTGQPLEERFVHPITSPYHNENSFVTTDVRAWFLYHSFPDSVLGGNAKVYAVQARAALTERIQLVAYKDGWIDFDSAIEDEGGNDVAAGIKWKFHQDWENQSHAALGLGYELGVGDSDVLQEDDEIRVWASYDKGFDRLHLGGNLNFSTPIGGEDAFGDSDRLSLHLHADYWVNESFSPVFELNWYETLNNGDNVTPFGGVDVANLGGNEDEPVITAAPGFEYRWNDSLAFRTAYETPLTDNVDLFGYRWTFSTVIAF